MVIKYVLCRGGGYLGGVRDFFWHFKMGYEMNSEIFEGV